MSRSHSFEPTALDALEPRRLLAVGSLAVPAQIGILEHHGPRRTGTGTGTQLAVAAQVNLAFNSFTTDYLHAQATYLAAGNSIDAFKAFTTQRVNLLAQDLTHSLSRLPGSFKPVQSFLTIQTGDQVALQTLLRTRINGGPMTMSLLQTLNSANTIPPPGTKPAATALYTLTATDAINAARAATLNAVNFFAVGNPSGHNHHHRRR